MTTLRVFLAAPMAAVSLAAVSLVAVGLRGQGTAARYRVAQFVPDSYLGEIFVDRLRLEECEIWDGLARSPVMGMLNGQLRSTLGFETADVDSLRIYPGPRIEERGGYRGTLMVLRGETLALEGIVDGEQQKVLSEQRDGIELLRVGSPWDDDPMCWLQHEPGVLIMGDSYIVEPVLDGERKGVGLPHPGLMPLQAGLGILAQVAFHFPRGNIEEGFNLRIPGLDPKDAVHGMLARLSETGDGEKVTLEVTLEFANADVNAPKVLEMAKQGLEQAEQHPQFAAMKGLWKGVEFVHDGKQIRATLPMGDSREATGKIVQVASLLPMLLFGRADSAAGPAPVAVPAAPADPAVPVKPGKGGGGVR